MISFVSERDDIRTLRTATLGAIPAEEWDRVVPDESFYDSHAWLSSVELDRTASPDYWLTCLRGKIAGALVTYRVHLEALPMSAPSTNPATAAATRGGDYRIAGGRRGYRSRLLVDEHLHPHEAERVAVSTIQNAYDAAVNDGQDGLCFMYLNERDGDFLQSAVGADVVALDEQAAMSLEGDSFDDWLQRLSRKLRYTIRRESRSFAQAGLTVTLEPLESHLDEVARLAAQTELRHGGSMTTASIARVLKYQAQAGSEHARLFMARDTAGRAWACALYFEWRHRLFARVFGSDPNISGDVFGYFNTLMYEPIRYAWEHGVRSLHLGTGSLEAKALRGATLEPSVAAFVRRRV